MDPNLLNRYGKASPSTGSPGRAPLPWKLLAVAFIFMSITAISVSMTFAAIAVQSAVRSYVAGEGQYSKAQRDASFLLHRYGQTGDPDYLRRFDQALAVPIGDRIAREEMQKPTYDRGVVERGLLDGDNHPADVGSLIWLFRCCNQLPALRRAIELWTRADEQIAQLQAIAVEMRTEMESKWPSAIALSELLSRVESVNETVHPIQAAFTATLGDAARSISSLLMMVTVTIILLLVALGTYLSLRIVRSIRSSSEQYRTLMHSASDGLIVVDRADGRVLEINECAEGMIGTSAAQLIGVPYNSLFSGPDVNLQPGFDQTGLQLSTLLAASGQPVEVEVKCSATFWNQRAAQLAIVRDVSKRLSTERMLRVATNAMANMTEAVVITDERFRVVSVNGAFTEITGFRLSELVGKVPGYRGVRSADRQSLRRIARSVQRDGRWQGELENVRKTGESYPMRLSLAAIPEADGRITHYVGVFSDNSAFRDYENRLKHLAGHDMLTDLPNRAAFEASTERAIGRARTGGGRLALLFIDLDGFKGVNDTWGHAAGDALLRTLSRRIQRCLMHDAMVARVGGDEFNVLLEDVGTGEDVTRLARQLLTTIGKPVEWEGQSIGSSASIGISFYPQDAADVDALVTHADMAMYQAKSLGRNNFQVFSSQTSIAVKTRLALVNGLRGAIAAGQFELHYQPCVDLASGRILGLEALLRWNHPELGSVPPAQFIPLAEEIGVIDAISDWVLQTACAQGVKWRSSGMDGIPLAVNLSPRNFWDQELPSRVSRILEESGWPASLLCLEITEGTIMTGENAGEPLKHLTDLGIALAIDDFGVGYSSLGSLRQFPVDVLKIDRTFTHGIPENSDNLALVRTIITLARSLGLSVIAEGIETRSQHDCLLAEGCLQGQGYLYGRPMPAAQIEAVLFAAAVKRVAELT